MAFNTATALRLLIWTIRWLYSTMDDRNHRIGADCAAVDFVSIVSIRIRKKKLKTGDLPPRDDTASAIDTMATSRQLFPNQTHGGDVV